MKKKKVVYYQCHYCGYVTFEKPESLTCPQCFGNLERRSSKK